MSIDTNTNTGAAMQTSWHKKALGESVCSICGCDNVRAGVLHKANTAQEAWESKALWTKRVKVAFGQDWDDRPIKAKEMRVTSIQVTTAHHRIKLG